MHRSLIALAIPLASLVVVSAGLSRPQSEGVASTASAPSLSPCAKCDASIPDDPIAGGPFDGCISIQVDVQSSKGDCLRSPDEPHACSQPNKNCLFRGTITVELVNFPCATLGGLEEWDLVQLMNLKYQVKVGTTEDPLKVTCGGNQSWDFTATPQGSSTPALFAFEVACKKCPESQ
jgi:hypothetical protein